MKKSPFSSFSAPAKGSLPLPPPPISDKTKSTGDNRSLPHAKPAVEQDKLAALKAYRRTLGQCYKCAEKWSPGHLCAPAVQLHVVQEIWDLFQSTQQDASASTLFVAVSKDAMLGSQTAKTLKFQGNIQGYDILILVDSGSSHTFTTSS